MFLLLGRSPSLSLSLSSSSACCETNGPQKPQQLFAAIVAHGKVYSLKDFKASHTLFTSCVINSESDLSNTWERVGMYLTYFFCHLQFFLRPLAINLLICRKCEFINYVRDKNSVDFPLAKQTRHAAARCDLRRLVVFLTSLSIDLNGFHWLSLAHKLIKTLPWLSQTTICLFTSFSTLK